MTEHDLVAAGHPRYVSPAGDVRYRAVPCDICRRPTLALSPPRHLSCDVSEVPATSDGGDVSIDHVTATSAKRPAPVGSRSGR